MERLTERCVGGVNIKGCSTIYANQERKGAPAANAIVRLAAYEDAMPLDHTQELARAEKDGRLMVLPVKEGTTVYRLRLNFDGDRYEIIEKDFSLAVFRPEDFGRIIFRTREEAEAALKRKEEEDNAAN